LNLAINVLLLNFVLDLYLTPLLEPGTSVTFSRVGAVGPDSAKIAVRYPFSNATEGIVHVVYRQVLAGELLSMEAGAWKDGPVASVSEDSDWTAVVKLSGLWPSTSYECTPFSYLFVRRHPLTGL
jgi:alkaline phosphatase D